MKDLEHYKSCSQDDFIVDEEFRELVRDADSSDRLAEFIRKLPEKSDEINLAVKIIKGLQLHPIKQSPEKKEELWLEILLEQKKKPQFALLFSVAASLLLLIGLGSAIFYYRYPEVRRT